MQKRKKIPALLLTLLLMLVLAPAAYADTDANTPQITQQPDQLVLQLGARWAGVEFELRTDAGVFPVPVVVDESGRQHHLYPQLHQFHRAHPRSGTD